MAGYAEAEDRLTFRARHAFVLASAGAGLVGGGVAPSIKIPGKIMLYHNVSVSPLTPPICAPVARVVAASEVTNFAPRCLQRCLARVR